MSNCVSLKITLLNIVATRCKILRLKCTKIDFGWGFAPDLAANAYSARPDPLAQIKGPTSKGRDGVQGGEGEKREGKAGGGNKRGKEGNGGDPVCIFKFSLE